LLFSKVQKAFDKKDVQLAAQNRQIESLEAQIDADRARKRKKVKLSPNSKFANIEAIRKAQIEAGSGLKLIQMDPGVPYFKRNGRSI